MQKLFERIKIRDELVVPTTSGFCLLQGFMQGYDREWKELNNDYKHESIAGFSFFFNFNDYIRDYALLDKPEGYVTQGRGNTIYKGTRKSNCLQLEE